MAPAVTAVDGSGGKNILAPAIAFHPTQDPISSADMCRAIAFPANLSGDMTHPAGRNQGQETCIAFGADCFNGALTGDVAATMGTRGSSETASGPTLLQAMRVRRLMPIECERLQGFPDGYTAIPWRGKPADQCPDGPRYKALGNSWAVPCVRWIGERIDRMLRIC